MHLQGTLQYYPQVLAAVATNDFSPVAKELSVVVGSGPCGKFFFEHILQKKLAQDVTRQIEAEIDAFFSPPAKKDQTITLAQYEARVQYSIRNLEAIEGLDVLEEKRKLTVKYGSLDLLEVPVSGHVEQVEVMYSSAAKALGAFSGKLPQVSCESVLTGASWTSPRTAVLCEDVLAKAAALRSHIHDLVGDKAIQSSDKLMQVVLKEALTLAQLI